MPGFASSIERDVLRGGWSPPWAQVRCTSRSSASPECSDLLLGFLGELVRILDHLGYPAGLRVGIAVMKNAEQVMTTVRRRHPVPSFPGESIASEYRLENGRRVEFAFHSGQHSFGDL